MHLVLSGDLGGSFLFLEQLDNDLRLEGGCVMSFHTGSLHDPCAVRCLNSLGHYKWSIVHTQCPFWQMFLSALWREAVDVPSGWLPALWVLTQVTRYYNASNVIMPSPLRSPQLFTDDQEARQWLT